VGRSLQLGGRSALLLRLLLSQQAGRVANKLGVDSGADMRAARRAAEEIGAQVVLGTFVKLGPFPCAKKDTPKGTILEGMHG
jgi:hypothetical protein